MNLAIQLRAVIIDDAPQAIKLLRLMLEEHAPQVQVLGIAEDAETGLQLIQEKKPNLVFLDIEMPRKSGLYLAEQLLALQIPCDVIFTTAYNQYAIQAFRLSAIDYLLKPLDEKELVDAIQKVHQHAVLANAHQRLEALKDNFVSNTPKTLSLPALNGFEFVTIENIEYFEADGSYVHVFLADQKQKTISKNLKYVEQLIEHCTGFVRVHRSYLINIAYMKAFSKAGRGTITMQSGKIIDLARDRRNSFFQLLGI